jgi:hypothetical protein
MTGKKRGKVCGEMMGKSIWNNNTNSANGDE